MYIGASFKNKRQKIVQRQHQSLLFKEIQFNKIVQDIKLQDQLKKSNGFISHKINILIKSSKENSLKKIATCATFRHGSFSKNKAVNQLTYRPSVTSIINEKQELCSKRLLKTTGQFFKNKSKNQTLHNVENSFIEQTTQEKGNQHQADINTFSSKQELQKKFREIFSKSLDDSMMKKKSIPKKLTTTRNKVTFLDLKVKNIQKILQKAGKNQAENFSSLVQKDQKNITDWGWRSFYKSVQKENQKKEVNIKEKLLRLKRTAASDHMKSEANPNPIHKVFVKQKKQNQQNLNVSRSQKTMRFTEKDKYFNQKSSFTSQNAFKFFNFVKGVQNHEEFSKQISLKQYRQNLQKFYVLQNSQQVIKQTQDYKNIKLGNFQDHSKDELLTFVYMNENQYKLRGRNRQRQRNS